MYNLTPQQWCLWKLAIHTWFTRGSAKSYGLTFGEETSTDILLLNLAENFPGDIQIVTFTKRTGEPRTGADWAWGFVGPGGHFQGMLVQAKRLDDNEKKYSKMYYKSQLNTLITTAKRLRVPPLFAFYNHLNDIRLVPSDRCCSMVLPCAESWGITIASAFKVRSVKPDKTFDTHKKHSIPLHCLLCSGISGQQRRQGSAGYAALVLSRMFDRSDDEEIFEEDIGRPFEPTTELPDLFQEVRDGKSASEISERYPGIAGVVLIQDRKDGE